jgi:predicted nucleotidyltransferase
VIRLIANRLPGIAVCCRAFGVRRLNVFASAARGDFDPRASDIDLIVLFDDPWSDPLRQYVSLTGALESLLGYRVSLVFEAGRSNPWLWAEIDRCREVIYDADPGVAVPVTISRPGLAPPRGDPTPVRLFEVHRAAEDALQTLLERPTDGTREAVVWGALLWSVLRVDRSLGGSSGTTTARPKSCARLMPSSTGRPG